MLFNYFDISPYNGLSRTYLDHNAIPFNTDMAYTLPMCICYISYASKFGQSEANKRLNELQKTPPVEFTFEEKQLKKYLKTLNLVSI